MTEEIKYNQAELEEMEEVFAELDADFEEMEMFGLEEEGEFSELDQEMKAAGLLDSSEVSFSSLAEDDLDLLFLGGWLKRKVRKLIRTSYKIVKKYGKKCAPCAAKLANTVRLFKKGKYAAALRSAYNTYKCVKKCAA